MGSRVTTAKAVVVLLVCIGLWVARPFAAQDSAALSGMVTDGQGGVLPGATVTASGPALIQPQTTTSASDGVYRFAALPSGVYALTFEAAGFRTLRREGIRVSLNTTLTVDAQLPLASVSESVSPRCRKARRSASRCR